jgi:hypothetical protein
MFTLNKRGPNYYTVDTTKFNTVGEIYREVDGFYVFAFLEQPIGCFPEYFFTFVSNALESLNDKWKEQCQETI